VVWMREGPYESRHAAAGSSNRRDRPGHNRLPGALGLRAVLVAKNQSVLGTRQHTDSGDGEQKALTEWAAGHAATLRANAANVKAAFTLQLCGNAGYTVFASTRYCASFPNGSSQATDGIVLTWMRLTTREARRPTLPTSTATA
jgi:hypothetical protein